MFTNVGCVIPGGDALPGEGAAPRPARALMTSVVALGLPDMIMLEQVPTPRPIAIFVAVVATGIRATDDLFDLLLRVWITTWTFRSIGTPPIFRAARTH